MLLLVLFFHAGKKSTPSPVSATLSHGTRPCGIPPSPKGRHLAAHSRRLKNNPSVFCLRQNPAPFTQGSLLRRGVNDHSGRFRLATLYTREPFAAPRGRHLVAHRKKSRRCSLMRLPKRKTANFAVDSVCGGVSIAVINAVISPQKRRLQLKTKQNKTRQIKTRQYKTLSPRTARVCESARTRGVDKKEQMFIFLLTFRRFCGKIYARKPMTPAPKVKRRRLNL